MGMIISNNKENKQDATNAASMVTQILTDINIYSFNNYINLLNNKLTNKESIKGNQIPQRPEYVFQDYNELSNANYINFLNELIKDKGGKNVTPTVKDFLPRLNNYNGIKYINVSVDCNNAEVAALTLTVRDRLDESDLPPGRQPGSTPGRGASALFIRKSRKKRQK